MTEGDWAVVREWETDPEIIHWADTGIVASRTVEEVRQIFRTVSQHAFCFIVEFDGRPIGDGWLQEMNLEKILRSYPGLDCRRIDLVIGEKDLWGRGWVWILSARWPGSLSNKKRPTWSSASSATTTSVARELL